MAKCYYNGVLLPEIPADVLASHPYAWIRKHVTNGQYQLIFGKEPWYYKSSGLYCSIDAEEPWYNITISTASEAIEWTFNKETTGYFSVDDARHVLWSNHDLPNGSATSTTIYFYATEPVKETDVKPKELDYDVLVDFFPSSGAINYSVNDQTINYAVPVVKYSTYTVTMTEVGNRLRAVFTTVDPAMITANVSATDIVMNPTFSVGYKFTYFAKADGWLVVYVSNSGERPKISIVTNGAGGDGAPLYDRKYLIRSNSTLYTITDGALSTLTETELTASLFQTYGVDNLPDGALLVGLIDPEVLYWQDSTDALPTLIMDVTGVPPIPQVVISESYDMSDTSILGIESVTIDASEDTLFALSFDDGATWKAYDGTQWVTLEQANSGMTAETFQNISLEAWAQVVTGDVYRLRFVLMGTESYVTSVVIHYINQEG